MKKIYNFFNNSSYSKLLKHSLNYGIGDVLAQLIGFLLIPLYTRYLTSNDYGIVEICTTIIAFSTPFMKLGLPGSVTRHYYDYYNDTKLLNNYITTVYKLLNLSAIILGFLLLVVAFLFKNKLFEGIDFFPFIIISIVSAGISSNNQLQQKLIQNNEESIYAAKIKIAITLLSLLTALFFVVSLKLGALGIVLSGFIVNILFFVQGYFYLKPYLKGFFNKEMAIKAIKFGIGILPHHISGSLGSLINKIVLVKFCSLSYLGIFSLALRFTLPIEMINSMLTTAFMPIYNSNRQHDNHIEIAKNVKLFLFIHFIIISLISLIFPLLIKLLLPIEYISTINLIPILCLGFIFKPIYNISGIEIFFMNKTGLFSLITISGLIINTICCLLLIEDYKDIGISWAHTLGSISIALFAFIYNRKVSNYYSFSKEFIVYLSISIIVLLFSVVINNNGFWF